MTPVAVFSVLLSITCIAQWHYILCIIDEMTTILNIKVFKVKPVSLSTHLNTLAYRRSSYSIKKLQLSQNNKTTRPLISKAIQPLPVNQRERTTRKVRRRG